MSNNKQSMKLYTEEEVVKLLDKYTVLTKIGAEFYLNKMTPIELPSDEEIEEQGNLITDLSMRSVYILGLKSMRDKIQGGDNEQQ